MDVVAFLCIFCQMNEIIITEDFSLKGFFLPIISFKSRWLVTNNDICYWPLALLSDNLQDKVIE